MSIDRARQEQLPRLTSLWQEAFGDSPEFIHGFFRTGFAPERSAVAEGGAGALYWFDCLWKGKKIAYIYAVATEKASRGRGICAGLMVDTHKTLKEQGYHGAILVPGDAGLARMYGKMGYVECPVAGRCGHRPLQTEEISAGAYMALRKHLLPEGGVEHTEPAFRYMETFLKFYRFPGGICCDGEVLPGGQGENAMYLPLDGSKELPAYFALSMG